MRLFRLLLTLCAVALMGSTGIALAQFSSNIQGMVQDQTQAVIPGATVTLENLGTGVKLTAQTNEAGLYRFSSLPPGSYEVSAEGPGFRRRSVKVTLLTAQTSDVNLSLEVQGATERVQVTAEAPVLDTADSRLQTTIQRQTLEDLPLRGRDALGLAIIAPGVTGIGATAAGSDNFVNEKAMNISANGRNMSGNQFTVDGLNVTSNILQGTSNLSPNADSIQEIAVQANTFSVEQGRASSIQVAVTTKSGTNQFHGAGSYFFNNQDLQARTVFTQKYDPFKRHFVAGSLGGPVIKNRTFVFASVETLRSQSSQATSVQTFESPEFVAWAQKYFPNSVGTKVLSSYPVTRAAVTGLARTARDIFGAQCGGPATYNLPCDLPMVLYGQYRPSVPRNGLQYSVRGDQYLNNNRDRIYANFYNKTLDKGIVSVRQGFPNFTNQDLVSAVQANWTHSFAANLLNEASFGRLPMTGILNDNDKVPFRVPGITIGFQGTGFSTQGGNKHYTQNNYNWRDVLSWVRSTHTLKFGFEAFRGDDYFWGIADRRRPTFAFNNLLDLVQDKPYTMSNVAYDPLTGQPGSYVYRYVLTTFGLFAQDEWKIRPNMTLTIGLRWDDYGNPWADKSYGTKLGNIILGSGDGIDQQFANAAVRQMDGLYNHRQNKNFSPRAGLAWDPGRNGRWLVRGGLGLYHDWLPLGEENRVRANPPTYIYPVFRGDSSTPPVFSVGNSDTVPFGFVYPTLPASQLDAHGGLAGMQVDAGGIDPNMKPSSTLNYSLGVERQLPGRMIAGATYSGSYTWNTVNGTDFNRFAGDLLDGKLDRLNRSFGQMFYEYNRGEIRYNSMILTMRRTFGSRGSFQASYTLSKTTDYGQAGSRVDRDSAFGYPDQHVFQAYKGPADWDVRHRFSLSGSYSLPSPSQPWLKAFLGGWEMTSVMMLQGGMPFMVVNTSAFQPIRDGAGKIVGFRPGSGDYNADGFNYDYPNTPSKDFTGSHSRQDFIRGLFTAADFPTPAVGSQGDLKRDIYRGPGFASVDAAMIKNIPARLLGESGKLQLRFEFFNILNRVNLTNVNGSLTSPSFGRSTSTYDPRIIQLGARLAF